MGHRYAGAVGTGLVRNWVGFGEKRSGTGPVIRLGEGEPHHRLKAAVMEATRELWGGRGPLVGRNQGESGISCVTLCESLFAQWWFYRTDAWFGFRDGYSGQGYLFEISGMLYL